MAANAHGLRVERRYGRSILNSLHGVWSIGAVGDGYGLRAGLALIPVVAAVVVALDTRRG